MLVMGAVLLSLALAAGCGSGTKKGAGVGGAIDGAIGHRLDQQAEELAQIAETRRTDQGIMVTLSSNRIQFASNGSELGSESCDVLTSLANVLKKYPEDIILIIGHTDSDGPAEYNHQLSQTRAQAVTEILIANGVNGAAIQIRGYGETQPIAPNTTPEGKAMNRRVELSITIDDSKITQD